MLEIRSKILLTSDCFGTSPKLVFVPIREASWQLPGLQVGVYPMSAVERVWTSNRGIGIKISPNGFLIVPDFASTAFMMQGATLQDLIAGFGDFWSTCHLSDMVTAYVILSRVKDVHGLLLLRAFSPELFRQNEPPGLRCVRKLLLSMFERHSGKFLGQTSILYTPSDAGQEYIELERPWKEGEQQGVQHGFAASVVPASHRKVLAPSEALMPPSTRTAFCLEVGADA